MTHFDTHARAFAGALAALAGYVDALGFRATGGFFVSFMSGNSTRLGVGAIRGGSDAVIAFGLLCCFVAGVMAGALLGHAARLRRAGAVLACVAVLLTGAALSHLCGSMRVAIGLVAAAMGGMNNVYERQGEVSIGLTYMTGSLVKLGQRLAGALIGGDRFAWAPYAWLWACFLAGVLGGAATFPQLGLNGLWGGAIVAAGLALAAPMAPLVFPAG